MQCDKPEKADRNPSMVISFIQVQESRTQGDNESVKRAINEYEDALARYIPGGVTKFVIGRTMLLME